METKTFLGLVTIAAICAIGWLLSPSLRYFVRRAIAVGVIIAAVVALIAVLHS